MIIVRTSRWIAATSTALLIGAGACVDDPLPNGPPAASLSESTADVSDGPGGSVAPGPTGGGVTPGTPPGQSTSSGEGPSSGAPSPSEGTGSGPPTVDPPASSGAPGSEPSGPGSSPGGPPPSDPSETEDGPSLPGTDSAEETEVFEPSPTPPSLSGFPAATHSAQTRTFERVPVVGNHQYDVVAYWPDETPAVPRPLVIFEHGFQLAASDFPRYGETLARYGFVALLPSTRDSGGIIPSSRDHALLAEDISAVIDWALAQNEDPLSPLRGRINAERIGAGGHSRGGKAAIWAATLDDRIVASWNLDPVDNPPQGPGGIGGTSPSVAPERMGDFTIPGVFLGSGLGPQGGGAFSPACAPAGENHLDFFNSAAGPVLSMVITDAGHNDFVERCHGASGGFGLPNECTVCPSGDHPEWSVAFSLIHQVAFYKLHLEEDESFATWVDGREIRRLVGWVDDIRRRNFVE